ncbi:MAG TPA: rhodanese-like domain-containing protein [Usitatibacter sp.]|nr:rhodanese-like domain-containing protein [Usitatibacter sp.]
MNLIFRQLGDPTSSTYTYLLADADTREAILIDPVFDQALRDAALIDELGLKLGWTLETHVHADHVTGAWLLKHRVGSSIAVGANSGAQAADRYLAHGDKISFGSRHLEARATPGHTNGCLTYVMGDRTMAFTGDCLLIRGSGRTDFQQGDPRAMWRSVHEQIFSLPGECLLYPGHDYRGLTVTSVAEERRFNPRLADSITMEDFVGQMSHLGLPHPRQIDVAVPANLRCGRPAEGMGETPVQSWAPLTLTFAGIHEIQPAVLEERMSLAEVIDVREPDEWDGSLGHIPGSKLIPLGLLAARAEEIGRTRPVVLACRSGARSAQAVVILQRLGFRNVVNLAGGLIRWRASGSAVEGGRE